MRIIIITEEEALHFGLKPLSLLNPEGLEKFFIKSFQASDFLEIDGEEYCLVLGDLDVARLLARFGYNIFIAEVNGKDVGRLRDVSYAFLPYASLKDAILKLKMQQKQDDREKNVIQDEYEEGQELEDETTT